MTIYVVTWGDFMKFANIRDLKSRTSELIRKTGMGEDVIITNRGKPVALLRSFTEDEIEEYILNHPKFLSKLDKISDECKKNGKDFKDLLRKKRLKF